MIVRWQAPPLRCDFDITYKAGKLNVHADAMLQLTHGTKNPPLEKVIADYYLPLNVVCKEPEDGLEVDNRNVKKGKLAEDELQTSQIVGDADMKQKYYDALLKYLILWNYPEEYGEKSNKSLRHVARLYCVNEGELYKKTTKEDKVDRRVTPTKQVEQILRECDDHILSGHQGIKATY